MKFLEARDQSVLTSVARTIWVTWSCLLRLVVVYRQPVIVAEAVTALFQQHVDPRAHYRQESLSASM